MVVPFVPRIENTQENHVLNLDSEMEQILHDENLPVGDKVRLYNQKLIKYISSLEKYNGQESNNSDVLISSVVENLTKLNENLNLNKNNQNLNPKDLNNIAEIFFKKVEPLLFHRYELPKTTKVKFEQSPILNKPPTKDNEETEFNRMNLNLFDDTINTEDTPELSENQNDETLNNDLYRTPSAKINNANINLDNSFFDQTVNDQITKKLDEFDLTNEEINEMFLNKGTYIKPSLNPIQFNGFESFPFQKIRFNDAIYIVPNVFTTNAITKVFSEIPNGINVETFQADIQNKLKNIFDVVSKIKGIRNQTIKRNDMIFEILKKHQLPDQKGNGIKRKSNYQNWTFKKFF